MKKRRTWKRRLVLCIALCALIIGWYKAEQFIAARKHAFEQAPRVYPVRRGTVAVYTNGRDLYKQLFADLAAAQKRIDVSFFSIGRDTVSMQFLEMLAYKSEKGVDVHYAVDRFGGILLSRDKRAMLQKAGVHMTYYNTPSLPYLFSTLDRRNHRRIVVIDGTIGYAGGMNIGKKYLGERKGLGHWRDYHLRISGAGAGDLSRQFAADWQRNTGRSLPLLAPAAGGKTPLRWTAYSGSGLTAAYEELFRGAKQSITIISPYFIPADARIWDGLLAARRKGVKVRILFSPHSDAPLVKQAAYPYIRRALRHGMMVYGYDKGVHHGKVLLVDDRVLMIGTANFDARSFHLNDELNCYILDSAFIRAVRPRIDEDFAAGLPFTADKLDNLPLSEQLQETLASFLVPHL